ncbi:MAG: AAA family ATPase, partial [Clostridium sp.]
MKIRQIDIKNFHGFEDKQFSFNNNFTVLIGENATGKTAVLDALAVSIGGFLLGIDDVDARNIRSDEVRLKQIEHGKLINIEPQYPVTIKSIAILKDKEKISWERSLNSKSGRTTRLNATKIIKYSKSLQKKVANGEEIVLPVFAYHGTGRLWAHIKDTEENLFETGSRSLGYKNCLNPISNEKLFLKWFKKMTLIEIQEDIKLGQFIAVKRAIEEFLKDLMETNIENNKVKVVYNINRDELEVTLESGKRLAFTLLSDGYRNIIGMVADIAFRMAVLNPFLEEKAIEETTGVVLI